MLARATLAIAAALGVGFVALAVLRGEAATPAAAWREIKWPFLIDQWGTGKAYRCEAADCGAEVVLYIRAKIGFCNCTTGVADDEELERVADVSLLDDRYAALTSGREIKVGQMSGRSRGYVVAGQQRQKVLALAFNERCDVIVATAVVAGEQPTAVEPDVLAFLNGDVVMRWAEQALGL